MISLSPKSWSEFGTPKKVDSWWESFTPTKTWICSKGAGLLKNNNQISQTIPQKGIPTGNTQKTKTPNLRSKTRKMAASPFCWGALLRNHDSIDLSPCFSVTWRDAFLFENEEEVCWTREFCRVTATCLCSLPIAKNETPRPILNGYCMYN